MRSALSKEMVALNFQTPLVVTTWRVVSYVVAVVTTRIAASVTA
jgi:hypothetical protein